MFLGFVLFFCFFFMAFWILVFVMGFVGLWATWGGIEMAKAKFAKKGFDEQV
ncbi:MAG: hypothetical protein H6599_10820 [Flavobacteriales bacterium]|nr:hypothetical protein [Flavobacteriales bacterium]